METKTYTSYNCKKCEKWKRIIAGSASNSELPEIIRHYEEFTTKQISSEKIDKYFLESQICFLVLMCSTGMVFDRFISIAAGCYFRFDLQPSG